MSQEKNESTASLIFKAGVMGLAIGHPPLIIDGAIAVTKKTTETLEMLVNPTSSSQQEATAIQNVSVLQNSPPTQTKRKELSSFSDYLGFGIGALIATSSMPKELKQGTITLTKKTTEALEIVQSINERIGKETPKSTPMLDPPISGPKPSSFYKHRVLFPKLKPVTVKFSLQTRFGIFNDVTSKYRKMGIGIRTDDIISKTWSYDEDSSSLTEDDSTLSEISRLSFSSGDNELEFDPEIEPLKNKRDGEVASDISQSTIMSSQFFSLSKIDIAHQLKKRIENHVPKVIVIIEEKNVVKVKLNKVDGAATKSAIISTLKQLFPSATVKEEKILIPWDSLVDAAVRNFRTMFHTQVDRFASTIIVEQSRTDLKTIVAEKALECCLKEIAQHYQPKDKPLSCFVSYARDDDYTVQVKKLVEHLRLAGFEIFDLDNVPSQSLARYIQKIDEVDLIVVIGTKELLKKYNGEEELKRDPVKAELELICDSFIQNEKRISRVRTTLWEGSVNEAFPPLLRTLLCIESFKCGKYEEGLLELIASLYKISRQEKDFQNIKRTYQERMNLASKEIPKDKEKEFEQQKYAKSLNRLDEHKKWMFDQFRTTLEDNSSNTNSLKLKNLISQEKNEDNGNNLSIINMQDNFSP